MRKIINISKLKFFLSINIFIGYVMSIILFSSILLGANQHLTLALTIRILLFIFIPIAFYKPLKDKRSTYVIKDIYAFVFFSSISLISFYSSYITLYYYMKNKNFGNVGEAFLLGSFFFFSASLKFIEKQET